jgi:tRNA threonylcarbamoyladenosine biosynthesis protein TsaB
MHLLNIETSTHICSIALSDGNNCIFSKSDDKGMNHAALLNLFIQEALEYLKKNDLKLDAVSVSSGPGSYTGLRIGVSTAKGLCYGFSIPLISVSTLEIMALTAINQIDKLYENALFCPMIDARRMEVYAAFYDSKLNKIRDIQADIIDEESYKAILDENIVYFFGNGMEKCKELLAHPNARFVKDVYSLANNMIFLSSTAFKDSKFENIAYFEPFYLKEFHVTTARKKY